MMAHTTRGRGPQGPASNDSPGTSLDATDRLFTATTWKFELYAMFLPPPTTGGNSRWVPLQVINWSLKGTCTWNGTSWDLTNNGQAADPNGAATTTHPLWTSYTYKGSWVKDQ